jgi:hypothetical protein
VRREPTANAVVLQIGVKAVRKILVLRSSGRASLLIRKKGGSAVRWDAAERNVLSGLQPFGMRDVFRSLHGYELDACSWAVRRKGGTLRRRFDHVFASNGLRTVGCRYVTAWREHCLSDHAAIEAVFEI